MKHENEKGENPPKNRISSLPDTLLADILSFIPTKEAVATSLLSRRWRYVHTWITLLDFEDQDHQLDTFPRFKMFVDQVLQNCQSHNISIFKIHFSKLIPRHWGTDYLLYINKKRFADLEPMHFNTWMCFPLTRGVTQLDICARVNQPGKLPSAIFACQTLQVLKLDVNLELELPVSVCLPNLKDLRLALCCFPNDDSVTRLLSSCCPSLQHLALCGYWDTLNPLYISAPFLRTLCLVLPDWNLEHRSMVVLILPNLEYLEYEDSFALHYSIGPMNALKEAIVNTTFNDVICPIDELSTLISSLSNVGHLFLKPGCLEALDTCNSTPKLPIFRKLNHLQLGTFGYYGWNKILIELLSCTPFLETLAFPEGIFVEADELDGGYLMVSEQEIQSWSNCQTVPSCLGFHLKRIAITKYEHTKWELEMIKYFLSNSLALEELVLVCKQPVAMENKISFDITLQQLPRSSSTCSIKIH